MNRALNAVVLLFLLACPFSSRAQSNADVRDQQPLEKIKSLIEARRFDEAISLIDEAIKTGPESGELRLQLGRAYANKFFIDGLGEHKEKALASLRKSIELNPSLAYAHFLIGQIAYADRRYKEAIDELDRATRLDDSLLIAYQRKWRVMVKSPDFESYLPAIRAEAESLLKHTKNREAVLETAAVGFDLLSDQETVRKVEDLIISEFPKSKLAEGVLLYRISTQEDPATRASQIESFLAQFPSAQAAAQLRETLFRTRLLLPEITGAEIARTGKGWVEAATRNAEQMIKARSAVALALAERKVEMAAAEAFAAEAVSLADGLKIDSPLLAPFDVAERDYLIKLLKEKAHSARGFMSLRKGAVDEAAKELTAQLEPVAKEVERNGFILWKDMDLRELGVRPRVLWLAELYEAQGQVKRAAKYLLAGVGDDPRANDFIKERLPIVYEKMGRAPDDAAKDLAGAEARYLAMSEKAASAKEQDKRRALASRINAPAIDFEVTRLDKSGLRLSDLKGKVIVLNFWATWCGPCLGELPHFQKAFEKYRDDPRVFFIAISTDENRAAVRPFLQKRGLTFPAAYDESAARDFKVGNIPATIIIDRGGIIQFREEGYGEDGKDYVERLTWRIDELLSKQAAPSNTPSN